MAGAIGNAKGINLNTASPEELDRIGGCPHASATLGSN